MPWNFARMSVAMITQREDESRPPPEEELAGEALRLRWGVFSFLRREVRLRRTGRALARRRYLPLMSMRRPFMGRFLLRPPLLCLGRACFLELLPSKNGV